MADLGLQSFNKIYPMLIKKYKNLSIDQNADIPDKINQIVNQLNALGKLSNDVVRDWNTVYNWCMNDGLSTDLTNAINSGKFNAILTTIYNSELGDLTTLQTSHKDNLVNAINDNVSSLTQKVQQGDLFINVKDIAYGAKGDGVTDDTTAIQNAINAIVKIAGGKLFFPAGTYKITNYINIPFGTGFIIEGASRGSVTIKQFTDNKQIFRFTTTQTHSWIIRNIDFEYNNSQPVTNTLAVPIYFALDSGTGGAGYYNFQIDSCTFNSGYYAISQITNASNVALWQVHVRNCIFGGTLSGGAIYINPSPAVGQPIIQLEKCYINAQNMQLEAINIADSDSVLLISVEFNGGTYSVGGHNQMLIASCSSVVLINCRSEVASVNGSGNVNLWQFPNTTVSLIGCAIGSITVGNGTTVYCINAQTASVRGLNIVGSTLGTGSYGYGVNATTFLVAENIIVNNGFSRFPNSSVPRLDLDNSQTNRTTINGDVSVTLTATSNPYQYFNTNLTANRTVTLPNSGLYDGLTFTIVSRNTAAFTLGITDPLSGKNITIPASTKARVTYRAVGSNEWLCTDYSTGIA